MLWVIVVTTQWIAEVLFKKFIWTTKNQPVFSYCFVTNSVNTLGDSWIIYLFSETENYIQSYFIPCYGNLSKDDLLQYLPLFKEIDFDHEYK